MYIVSNTAHWTTDVCIKEKEEDDYDVASQSWTTVQ